MTQPCKYDSFDCPAMPLIKEMLTKLEAKMDEKLVLVIENQTEMKLSLAFIRGRQDDVIDKQKHQIEAQQKQGSEFLAVKSAAERASKLSVEALQRADQAQHEVTQMGGAIQLHVSGVDQTLIEHTRALIDQRKVLDGQDKVLDNQTKTLNQIHDSEVARTSRDEAMAKVGERQSAFIKWALPLGFTMMTTIVGATVWVMMHVQQVVPH